MEEKPLGRTAAEFTAEQKFGILKDIERCRRSKRVRETPTGAIVVPQLEAAAEVGVRASLRNSRPLKSIDLRRLEAAKPAINDRHRKLPKARHLRNPPRATRRVPGQDNQCCEERDNARRRGAQFRKIRRRLANEAVQIFIASPRFVAMKPLLSSRANLIPEFALLAESAISEQTAHRYLADCTQMLETIRRLLLIE